MAQSQRDQIKAGIFVLIGLLLAMGIVFTLADFDHLIRKQQTIHVYYQLGDGLHGLKEGAAVTLGDQPIGEVQTITPYQNPKDPTRVVGMKVTLLIPAKITLYWNARIELVAPPIGSGARLNIASVGGAAHANTPKTSSLKYSPTGQLPGQCVPDWAIPVNTSTDALTPAQRLAFYQGPVDAIPGSLASSSLIRDLTQNVGIEAQQKRQIQQIIANVERMTHSLKTALPTITQQTRKLLTHANTSLARLDASLENVKQVTGNIRSHTDQWSSKIDATLADTRKMLGSLNKLVQDKKAVIASALDDARQTSQNLKKLTHNLRTQTFVQVTKALETARAALKNLKATSTHIRNFVASQKPLLERTLANAQIAGEQLKLATIEIRRSPWRLLHAPSDDELETDNLYDAARSFALAAGALDAASRSLQAISSETGVKPEQIQPILDRLVKIFEKFQKTEETFWNALGKYSQTKP